MILLIGILIFLSPILIAPFKGWRITYPNAIAPIYSTIFETVCEMRSNHSYTSNQGVDECRATGVGQL